MTDIGVIIPTFNDAHLMEVGLNSLLGQTLPPVEIVVIDDGSTSEESRDAIVDLKLRFPFVSFKQQDNLGPSGARNFGLSVLASSFVAFLDADDSMRADCLESRARCIAESRDIAGAYGGYRMVRHGKLVSHSKFECTDPTPMKNDAVGRSIPGGLPHWLIRTDVIRSVGGFDSSLLVMEDFDLLLRIGRLGGLYCGNNYPTYIRNLRASSFSRSSLGRSYFGTMRFLSKANREGYFSKTELIRRYAHCQKSAIAQSYPLRWLRS